MNVKSYDHAGQFVDSLFVGGKEDYSWNCTRPGWLSRFVVWVSHATTEETANLFSYMASSARLSAAKYVSQLKR